MSSYQQIAAQAGVSPYDQNPFSNQATRESKVKALRSEMDRLQRELERITLDEPLESPTQRMLNNHEALKNAWEEMMVIWKLIGK